MHAISQKKVELSVSSITRDGLRPRRSVRSTRCAERAAPLWTARRDQIAARRRNARCSRFAMPYVMRPRLTASAPTLRAAAPCHARRLRIRRIGIMRSHRGLRETVTPQEMALVKENGHGRAFGQLAQNRKIVFSSPLRICTVRTGKRLGRAGRKG
jgi:hypothetical protein